MLKKPLAILALMAAGLVSSHAAITITEPTDTIGAGTLDSGTGIFTIATAQSGFLGNYYPAGESPAMAIDGNPETKYLNFNSRNTGYIVTPTYSSYIVTSLFLSTGGDAPERDPLTFSLYGSNSVTASSTPDDTFDLADFTPIVLDMSTGLETDPGRNTASASQPTFANDTAYTTYLLVFPTVRQSDGSPLFQIGEARLEAVPEPTSALLLSLGALGFLGFRRRN
ncbi:PEP-CTERM sorting domain-containing protein [Luteolibacter pohnpeiensis]|uniref:PEP-CTERM sorting domain-containing protein n=1 Tax=Luteolibacter pohnpeiensis TaxID=454153 RepID=A0A934S9G7_9BACT|nr:PEP-CTERM sorting domain-containing protein [Luteolibacter pohnpeiensis]MBK1881268.1 PEP-CTERM sorting domain-containing protein [Luteolibacter pohnpeiensis]